MVTQKHCALAPAMCLQEIIRRAFQTPVLSSLPLVEATSVLQAFAQYGFKFTRPWSWSDEMPPSWLQSQGRCEVFRHIQKGGQNALPLGSDLMVTLSQMLCRQHASGAGRKDQA
jgi:hypothetical protein